MTVLWWLIPAVVATLLAVGWVAWASRARPPADMHETVEDYERFKAAMEREPRRRKGRRAGRPDDGADRTPRKRP